MKTFILSISFLLILVTTTNAQRYATKNGYIRFFSDAPLEKIEAHNRQVNAALDINSGDYVFRVLMKSFKFEKALMEEHFNENYVESDKFPNATFLGKITNVRDVNILKEGVYPVTVEGKLTIRGVTNPVKIDGTLEVKEGRLTGKAKFMINLDDFKISIPTAVVSNISKNIEITVETVLEKINL